MPTATASKTTKKTERKTERKTTPQTTSRTTSGTTSRAKTATRNAERGAETADRVLEQVQTGGQNAISAVRQFVDSLDESITGDSSKPTVGHDIIDSALAMSDRLVEHGGDAIRGILRGFAGNGSKS